jgi:hypothetical protein
MLIIDNSEAVMFFRTDDVERRSWTEHADPVHVAAVQQLYDDLLARSERLGDISRMNWDEVRKWLEETRTKLLLAGTRESRVRRGRAAGVFWL